MPSKSKMKFKAWKHGFGIEEVPIIFYRSSKGNFKNVKKEFSKKQYLELYK